MSVKCLHYRVYSRSGVLEVEFGEPGTQTVESEFIFNASGDSQVAEKLLNITENTCNYDDIFYVGEQLWLALNSGKVGPAVEKVRAELPENSEIQVRLSIADDELKHLPWEALYDPTVGPLAGERLYSVVHDPPPGARVPPFVPRSDERLSMLVIVPKLSGLNAGLELNNISREASLRGVQVECIGRDFKATPKAVSRALTTKTWDIVHYVGHGLLNEKSERLEVLLESENGSEFWLDAEIFARDFSGAKIRLVVTNCCFTTGSSDRDGSLNGMGSFLMRRGVPAVVAMRYAIDDPMAILFSAEFYQAFFNGSSPGRVDLAAESAKDALLRNQPPTSVRSFITPVLYLSPGYEQLIDFTKRVEPPQPPPPFVQVGGFTLPEKLRSSIRERRCIPVIGPGILQVGAVRSSYPAGVPVGTFELARELAAQLDPPYPPDELEAYRRSADRTSGEFLQAVCQIYQQARTIPKVIEHISNTYSQLKAPQLLERLASWDVPGMFYTYFDGLLEQCIRQPNRPIIWRIEQLNNGEIVSQKPVILLRGSLKDPSSLVLTEYDHLRLLASVTNMPPGGRAIFRQLRRSTLFLGLSPGDSLVRQMSQTFLEPGGGRSRLQETSFFVCPLRDRRPVDIAFWGEFELEWLDGELEQILAAILDAIP